jgi:hypothetical protein
MKPILSILLLIVTSLAYGQITTPTIKANFGIDGDLKANFSNNGQDDWFNNISSNGIGVIDTTGAAAINSRYASNPNSRTLPFGRTMAVPPLTIVNNKLLLDAIFLRDYHGSDSTMFAEGSNKNGMSPADWSCPVAQSVPDKNEILDVMAHLRRDGTTSTDSLWLFGGVSIESTSGNRYFDYEMYQTDLYYDRAIRKFSNYGPDGGHTSWKFDAAGNVTQAGDISFSANYGSSSLTSIEAKIWVNIMSLFITPAMFSWSGTFDGGPQFGYATIKPKTSGPFYIGLQSPTATWAGAFSLIRGDNSLVTEYTAGQYMEFAVNLTKLGIDSRTLLGNFGCSMPFKRILVKSRTSNSFTSSLKDFIGPFDLFEDFKPKTKAQISTYCGLVQPSVVRVINPLKEFIYTWSTPNGHIAGSSTGDSIIVDSAGTYIVKQQLGPGCPAFATDAVVVPPFDKTCIVLETQITNFSGKLLNQRAQLNWSVLNNKEISFFEVESSIDGIHFEKIKKIGFHNSDLPIETYNFIDDPGSILYNGVYYRLKIISVLGKVSYSKILRLSHKDFANQAVKIVPNPVKDVMQISILSSTVENIQLTIYDAGGRLMREMNTTIQKGNSILTVNNLQGWPNGVYSVKVILGNDLFIQKMILRK